MRISFATSEPARMPEAAPSDEMMAAPRLLEHPNHNARLRKCRDCHHGSARSEILRATSPKGLVWEHSCLLVTLFDGSPLSR
jgi:hypothetical protein